MVLSSSASSRGFPSLRVVSYFAVRVFPRGPVPLALIRRIYCPGGKSLCTPAQTQSSQPFISGNSFRHIPQVTDSVYSCPIRRYIGHLSHLSIAPSLFLATTHRRIHSHSKCKLEDPGTSLDLKTQPQLGILMYALLRNFLYM